MKIPAVAIFTSVLNLFVENYRTLHPTSSNGQLNVFIGPLEMNNPTYKNLQHLSCIYESSTRYLFDFGGKMERNFSKFFQSRER